MTLYAPSITETQIFTALRSFLTTILPGVEVVQGQDNRVPEPLQNFVVMTRGITPRLSTNVDTWEYIDAPATIEHTASTEVVIQLDVHGPDSGDLSQTLRTLLRSRYAVEVMGPSGVTPLYADDPVQMPFQNAEFQFENRWVIMAHLQVSPTVSTPQDFASTLAANVAVPADTGA